MVDPTAELSDQQIERYARHLVLPEVEEEGQLTLLKSRVLVIGAGGAAGRSGAGQPDAPS